MVSKSQSYSWSRKLIIIAVLLLLCGVVISYYTPYTSRRNQIVLKVVGPSGEALVGAKIYRRYSVDDKLRRSDDKEYVCDKKGIICLPEDEVFHSKWQRKEGLVLYGLYEDELAGFVKVSADDLNKKVELKLTPVCRVYGKLDSIKLNNLGQKVEWACVDVYFYDTYDSPLSYSSRRREFEFLLPNGKYTLDAYGTRLYEKEEDIEVKAGQKELEINFDLPADRLAHLIGKEAPELQQVKGWINSEPIKLADLRGKVVLLDFWGTWCGPCVGGIPGLIDLHEKYHDKGLVIIGIHDDSWNSMKELKEEIEKLSKKHWNGREIPFVIALDGGGRCKIEGTKRTASGVTTAAYGIQGWPTMVLIDKEGKVVEVPYGGCWDIEMLEELLGPGASVKQVVLKVVGPDGKALPGAKIYKNVFVDDREPNSEEELYVCDEKGLARLPESKLFNWGWYSAGLYGLYEDKLAGFVVVKTSDLDKVVKLKLEPASRVYGKIKSTELTNVRQKMNWTNVHIRSEIDRSYLSCVSQKGEFEFFLPNGRYRLEAHGTRLYKEERVRIETGQGELEIDFDQPVDHLIHLAGKQAPELRRIKRWINGKPMNLAGLRGKVVMLVFWRMCGSCIRIMPELIDLHEKYHDKGLVIIGIYDDLYNSVEEIEKEIKELNIRYWNGKMIPVALDEGGDCKVEGTKKTVSGATTAAYGINGFPTMVLIDKEGKVVKQYYYSSGDGSAEVLEKLLAAGVDNGP